MTTSRTTSESAETNSRRVSPFEDRSNPLDRIYDQLAKLTEVAMTVEQRVAHVEQECHDIHSAVRSALRRHNGDSSHKDYP